MPETVLCQIARMCSTDKGPTGHNYTPIYARLLEELRRSLEIDSPRGAILEIGVGQGASLHLWRAALPQVRLFAVDIEEKSGVLPAGVRFARGDAHDAAFLDSLFPGETFDLVIDDGSHRAAGWWMAFTCLLPRVTPGGYLVIEDIHSWVDGWPGTEDAAMFWEALIRRTVRPDDHPFGRYVGSVRFEGGLCIVQRRAD